VFVHYELRTTDPAAAARFYGALLGWQAVTYPGGAAFRAGEATLGGASRTNPGVPPHWTGFIKVADVDAAAGAAAGAGGIVTASPVDIPGFGRLSVALDPQRAVVGFVDAGDPPSGVPAPYLGGNDLHTPDVDEAAAFYRATVGWTRDGARFVDADGVAVAGIRPGATAAAWLPYLIVDAVEPLAARAAELGGAVDGAVLRDPQGAVLALRAA
jgi:predicted enzyme related to lactoylglutathione lyase